MQNALPQLLIPLLVILGIAVTVWLIVNLIGIRIIRPSEVGIVEKWWSPKGSLDQAIIALNGEAGYQPDVLRSGIHFKSPFMYRVHKVPLITISQGKIGYIFARDGKPLEPTQLLGSVVSNFMDAREFLTNNGQRGPQRGILREGTYALNTALFAVITSGKVHYLSMGDRDDERKEMDEMSQKITNDGGFEPVVIDGSNDAVGIVIVNDGPNPPEEQIICPTVGNNPKEPDTYHHSFQDPEKFLKAGGLRGKQHQVLIDGKYYINRLFATVEFQPKTVINVGCVGVVISYYGDEGVDISGDNYTHGKLVENGKRGIWGKPLMPGKYPINIDAAKVISVPTTNFVLKWDSASSEAHGYDSGLAAVQLITSDAFEPELPLSVVLSINCDEAPKLIQKFGDIKVLVEQSLDPMVSSFFKNAGQKRTLLQLVQQRSELGEEALKVIKARLADYNLELHDVLIGTPRSASGDKGIETMYAQLRDRQIAVEKILTYKRQGEAAEQEKQLRQAEATANQQTALTESEIRIVTEENVGKAEKAKAVQDAARTVITAEAQAKATVLNANADSTKIAKIGIAEGIATKQKVNAYGGAEYQVYAQVAQSFADAIKAGKQALVPVTTVNLGNDGEKGGANALSMLLNLFSVEKLREFAKDLELPKTPDEEQATIDELTKQIMSQANAETEETAAESKPHVAEEPKRAPEVPKTEPKAEPGKDEGRQNGGQSTNRPY
ncbi:MAG: SPFH domain-containing protein [Armatimonadota bacterium]